MELNIQELIASADFMAATKNNYRYASGVGELTTEDLWALPEVSQRKNTSSLHLIAAALIEEIKAETEMNELDAFLNNNQKSPSLAHAKLAIVMAVIATKREDAKARVEAAMRQQVCAELKQEISSRERDLSGKSLDELRAELEKLAHN